MIDRISGLMWARDNGTNYTWVNAINKCDTLSYGYTDWRLPTHKELIQAYVDGIYSQNAATKLNLWSYYWSATSDAQTSTNAWNINFIMGLTNVTNGKTQSYRAICVRP